MSGKPEWIKDELTEGGEEEPQVHEEVRTPLKATTPAPSVSIIKTPEDVPAALTAMFPGGRGKGGPDFKKGKK